MKLYTVGDKYHPIEDSFNEDYLNKIKFSDFDMVCKEIPCEECPFFKEIYGEGHRCILCLMRDVATSLLLNESKKCIMCDGILKELIEVEE